MRWPSDLDPARLRQPDPTSCGAASVLAARAILTPWRPESPEQIRDEHRLLTSSRSPRDRFQVPWPRRLGTPPWAVANAMRVLTGRQIATVHVRPRPAIGWEVVREQVRIRPVALYIGSRWLPRHVVLAVDRLPDAISVFDPASGRLLRITEEQFTHHRIDVAGWSHAWFVV
ncbi:hypothetical protein ACFQ0K_03935 [Nocardioides caeni]|uniref:Peptidase C39 domain-containing protein n=1 Tax=Nocardioides caeni TaxID=574700 RepID=A0A4S8N005_9ACTN|nr:hypothetical protein [Nocardioides caeni]THV09043.1 hypothetical protein E9934_17810 [Nocardioides caeni]